jgi:hypothetical protein
MIETVVAAWVLIVPFSDKGGPKFQEFTSEAQCRAAAALVQKGQDSRWIASGPKVECVPE